MEDASAPAMIAITGDALYPETISPLIYGDFIEFLNDLVPGMWAEKVQDRSFAGMLQPAHTWPLDPPWTAPRWHAFVCGRQPLTTWPTSDTQLDLVHASADFTLDTHDPFVGTQSARVAVKAADDAPFLAGIAQEHIAVVRGQKLTVELYMRAQGPHIGPVTILLRPELRRLFPHLRRSRVPGGDGRVAEVQCYTHLHRNGRDGDAGDRYRLHRHVLAEQGVAHARG